MRKMRKMRGNTYLLSGSLLGLIFDAATCSKSHLIVHIYYSVKEAVAQQTYWGWATPGMCSSFKDTTMEMC